MKKGTILENEYIAKEDGIRRLYICLGTSGEFLNVLNVADGKIKGL